MDKSSRFEITEIFMAKAGKHGWDRCYHGTIKRETCADGNPVVFGNIKVGDGFICAMAKDQWVLGDRLDELVLMVLDYDIHNCKGITTSIRKELFNLN